VTLSGGPTAARGEGPPSVITSAAGQIVAFGRISLIAGGDGQFVFRDLARGSYSVLVTKPGYLPGGYGMQRPGGTTQSIPIAGDQRSNAVIRLFRVCTIAGTVMDDLGEPIVGARIVAGRRVGAGLRPGSGFQSTATTDDRGAYRITNLTPGEYTVGVINTQTSVLAVGVNGPNSGTFVSADRRFVLAAAGPLAAVQDGAGRPHAYANTFYPSSRTSAQATPLVLRAGDERLGVDLTIPLLPAAAVSGRITSPDGQPAGYLLRLTPTEPGTFPIDLPAAQTLSDADGSFSFLGVPSGRYVLQTERNPPRSPPGSAAGRAGEVVTQTQPMLWAMLPVDVGGSDISDLAVVTQPGVFVSGRVDLEGAAMRAGTRWPLSLTVESLEGSTRTTLSITVIAGSLTRFTSLGLTPGLYRATITPFGEDWDLKSAMAGAVDLTDGPFEIGNGGLPDVVITLTDRLSAITGTVRVSGNADPGAVVLAFPSDTRYWPIAAGVSRRFVSARADPKGAFGPINLRPGDYNVVAVSDEHAADWQEPRVLEVLARSATRVTLGEGQAQTVELTRTTPRPPISQSPNLPISQSPNLPISQSPNLLAFRGLQVRDTRAVEPKGGPGSVAGVVLAADGSNRPIPRARVSLRPLEARQDFATISDAAGRFAFPRVPAGRFTMTVSKPAYLTAHYGTGEGVLPPGLPIAVDDGKAVTGITLRLVRGGVITGRVIDEYGQPMLGARIQVLQPFGEERRLSPVVIVGTPVADERGEYRIFGLQPGKYAVAASPVVTTSITQVDTLRRTDNDKRVAAGPSYYPGTPMSSEASLVQVGAGQEVGGVDIPTRFVPAARVEGTVSSADGQPVPYVQIQLLPKAPSQLQGLNSASGRASADGTQSFSFYPVVPGDYVVVARAVDRGGRLADAATNSILWGQQDVDVLGEDLKGVGLVLRPATALSGRVIFEGTTADAIPDSRTLRLVLQASGTVGAVTVAPSAPLDAAGRFVIPNIVPGRYTFAATASSLVGTAPDGIWSLASAMAGGRDLLDYPLEVRSGQPLPEVVVTYSTLSAELSGRLIDAAGQPVRGMSILLFGTDRAVWVPHSRRVRAPIRPADDGYFRFINLAPGDYFLGVMTDVDPTQAGDPALLEQLAPAAIRVTIRPGEKKTQDIRIAGPPLAGVRAGSSARR
jgi:protocatechuate 3,4-dioxygenase beta subunit